jgi:hypothetical protein
MGLTTRRSIGQLAIAASAIALNWAPLRQAGAASLSQPSARPILTIGGKIAVFNKDKTAQFDRSMIEALGTSGFETMTPWYPDSVRFDGIRMDRLLETVGAYGDRIVAYSLNDYSTELPVSDCKKYNVLLAIKKDGEYMSVRDKGPLFIVYPFDSVPELKHQRFYARSAWQLARLVVH